MLKATLKGSYRNEKGNTVFVYAVEGPAAAIGKFKEAQGDYYREASADDQRMKPGTPIWFTSRCIGDSGSLIITGKGKVIANMSSFEKAASLAQQFGGNLGAELAKHAANTLLGTTPGEPAVTAAPTVEAGTNQEE